MSPFHAHEDALQAHARMPQGTQYRLLEDDPETPEEIAAEQQRRRVQQWRVRMNRAAADAGIPVERFIEMLRSRDA
jgi:hypothetical protein